MRVAVDGTPLLGPRTGVGEMTAGLAAALAARADTSVVAYGISYRRGRELAARVPPNVRPATAPLPARVLRWLWARVDRPVVERWTGPVDVVHATNFVAPPARAPVVVTVHDLTFERFPEMCSGDVLQYPDAIRRALRQGAVVHTPSEYVAAEVREAFRLGADRVVAIPNGVPDLLQGDPGRGRRRAGGERYVLSVGTVEPRKDFATLVRAFDCGPARVDPDVRLVIAGGDGWGGAPAELDEAIRGAQAADRIVRVGYVDPPARADLLAGASAFALSSRYEGFGLPPLEAMAAGVPVAVTAAGAVPEVVGGAALVSAVGDVEALAESLASLLSDATERDRLVAAGRARAARFTWDASAARAVELYRSLR